MSTNLVAIIDQVYKRTPNPRAGQNPTFTVEAGEVDVFHFIKAKVNSNEPLKAAMVADENNPYVIGAHVVSSVTDNILFAQASGSPIVKTKNLIQA